MSSTLSVVIEYSTTPVYLTLLTSQLRCTDQLPVCESFRGRGSTIPARRRPVYFLAISDQTEEVCMLGVNTRRRAW